MVGWPQIDRRKHEVDITERVLEGGVWTASASPDRGRIVALAFEIGAWSLGAVASAAQAQAAPSRRGAAWTAARGRLRGRSEGTGRRSRRR
jgi:hypothetical protein